MDSTPAAPLERILLAVDRDGLASAASVRAFEVAELLGAELDIVHAVEVPPALWPGLGATELDDLHGRARAEARHLALEQIEKALADAGRSGEAGTRLHVHAGHPARVILDEMKERHSDLLVLGPHQRDTLFDFGGTTRAVLARTGIPVWTQPETLTPIGEILVPIDFSDHCRRALGLARVLAGRLGATLRLVHCHVPTSVAAAGLPGALPLPVDLAERELAAAQAELQRWRDEHVGADAHAVAKLVQGDPIRTLREEAGSSDLVVMGTHGRTGLASFVLGSVARGLLRHTKLPVVVVPEPATSWQLEETEGRRDDPLDPGSARVVL